MDPPLGDIRALTASIASGDRDAFARLYESRFDSLFLLARRFTGLDEQRCLDIVQDAMIRAIRAIKVCDDEPALDAWLARVVRSAAIDAVRSERRRRARELAVAPARRESGADRPDPARVEWLRAEVARLEGVAQDLLRARFAEGGTLERIGGRLGLGPAAAHARIARAVATLRKRGGTGGVE
jgi:RNA polymerase sigma-70 factor (ECF subfamily)